MERKVEFKSRGETCKGVLQLPEGAKGKVPLVVMAGGWCYTKEIVMPHYATYLREGGVATLLFDYRRFGESAGEPRQHINPWDQIEDYKNAISFAETLDAVDPHRMGIWGISYSGGHVLIVAATDPRVGRVDHSGGGWISDREALPRRAALCGVDGADRRRPQEALRDRGCRGLYPHVLDQARRRIECVAVPPRV